MSLSANILELYFASSNRVTCIAKATSSLAPAVAWVLVKRRLLLPSPLAI